MASLFPMPTRAVRFKVRPATKDDMPAIRALVRMFPKQLVQQDLPRVSSFFVAISGSSNVIGCCALQIYSKRIAEVRTLAVHPDCQDHGVASQLVESCRQRAQDRGIKEIFAVTSQISFFSRLGFATFRRGKNRDVLRTYSLIPILAVSAHAYLELDRTTSALHQKK